MVAFAERSQDKKELMNTIFASKVTMGLPGLATLLRGSNGK